MIDRNIEFILDCLSTDDDEVFWASACEVFFEDAAAEAKDTSLFLEIGLCSDWIQPSYKRFTDSQALPLPIQSEKDKSSYSRLLLPEYDWWMFFMFDPGTKVWEAASEPIGEFTCFRCSLPAKTASLTHAVGHAAWRTESDVSRPLLYSFKKSEDDKWECFINPTRKN